MRSICFPPSAFRFLLSAFCFLLTARVFLLIQRLQGLYFLRGTEADIVSLDRRNCIG